MIYLFVIFFFEFFWRYVISLETGEGYYKTMEGQVKSKGIKQRTHVVKVEDGNISLIIIIHYFN